MAGLQTAVTAVEDALRFHAERIKALDTVLAELTALAGSNGKVARRRVMRATSNGQPRKRRRMSAASRKAISVRMRKHWAEKKRAEK